MGEPVLVALLFADRVIEEKNHKKGIIGTFSRFYADTFPVQFPPWFIYAAVTNISGENSFSLNLVLEKAQQVILPISGKCQVDNTRSVVELIFPVFRAIFPEEGIYALTFNIEGLPIGSRILEVFKRPDQPPANPPE
ncbi:MAG: hypothetical protein JXB88_07240 [Spirochaetales bacterium]|nr:hypothetical protein [Spirochaetales bacterium]